MTAPCCGFISGSFDCCPVRPPTRQHGLWLWAPQSHRFGDISVVILNVCAWLIQSESRVCTEVWAVVRS